MSITKHVNRDRRVARPRLCTFPWVPRRQHFTRSQVTRRRHKTSRYIGTVAHGEILANLLSSLFGAFRRFSAILEQKQLLFVEPTLCPGRVQQTVKAGSIRGAMPSPVEFPSDRYVSPSDVLDGLTHPSARRAAPVRERPLFTHARAIRQGPLVFWNPRDPTQGPVRWAHSTSYTMTVANGTCSITLPGSHGPRSDALVWVPGQVRAWNGK